MRKRYLLCLRDALCHVSDFPSSTIRHVVPDFIGDLLEPTVRMRCDENQTIEHPISKSLRRSSRRFDLKQSKSDPLDRGPCPFLSSVIDGEFRAYIR
jgi:hypothetical protein